MPGGTQKFWATPVIGGGKGRMIRSYDTLRIPSRRHKKKTPARMGKRLASMVLTYLQIEEFEK
ncbi:hypothetical protein GCM10007207_19780 [Asaia siamensis]|uniref:Uncharacterized protein n=1 Tax=Asaia siamensis TaxID=110479 RepID=A0ABQ1MAH9_9PROT|nr:hypothetical protein AA0323_1373 [Asaia siamensis NRIC 0323]GGC34258.1 hypothetical protein GCM10007207_19780 [Asaia siamensis]